MFMRMCMCDTQKNVEDEEERKEMRGGGVVEKDKDLNVWSI